MNGMRFTELRLRSWKNFAEAETGLASRVFIIGPNSAGKSNLLDAFRFLHDLAVEGGGLARSVELREGIGQLRSRYARAKQTEVALRVSLQTDAGAGWEYDLGFDQMARKDPRPVVLWEIVRRIGRDGSRKTILDRPDERDKADRELLTQTALQQVQANRDFREVCEFFRAVSYWNLVPELLRSRPGPLPSGEDSLGRDLLDRMRRTPPSQRSHRLEQIEKLLRVMAPQLEAIHFALDEQDHPHLWATLKHWRRSEAKVQETQLSDGTLRFIGLLWSLQESGGALLVEEPEGSLHPAVVKRLAPLLFRAQKTHRGRQVILATHSIDLLADEGIAADEVLLVRPSDKGSTIVQAASDPTIRRLMEIPIVASEAALPQTQAADVSQLDRLGL
jgi:predicted ATPase